MTYDDCLTYLFAQLPAYQRTGKAAYKADLSNIIHLMELLGNPHKQFKTIHIAGTNGKGSTAHMLAAIFQQAGYKTGLYTSPHLTDFRERIKINGEMIPHQYVVDFVQNQKHEVEDIAPSFFEWTVALCFDYFKSEQVDIAIIETGMGGRLDSTNVITPELSVITNIGLDHTQFLGNTIEAIAVEKAGIIKSEVPVVLGEMLPEAEETILKIARNKKAPVSFAKDYTTLPLPQTDLESPFTTQNLKTVLTAFGVLTKKFDKLNTRDLNAALKNAAKMTGLRGRLQILTENPLTIADVAHNKEGLELSFKYLRETTQGKLHIVFGTVNDKDLTRLLPVFLPEAHYYLCAPAIPRALNAGELEKFFTKNGFNATRYNSVKSAYRAANQNAAERDTIYAGGSTFVVAEIL